MRRLTLKKKLLFSCVFLVMLSMVPLSIDAVSSMKSTVVQVVLEKAKSDNSLGLEIINEKYPGEWSIKDGKLYKGDHLMNEDYDLVDKVSAATGDTVTIFQGNTRVSTTVKKEGQRAIGTQMSPQVEDTVLVKGQPYFGEADVVGVKYQTWYRPIRDNNGRVIGAWYVGVSKQFLDATINSYVYKIIGVALVILIIGVSIAIYLSRTLSRPIKILAEAAGRVAAGDMTVDLTIADTGDEVELLGRSFKDMVFNLRALIDGIQHSAISLAAASKQLNSNAESTASAIEQVSSNMSQLAASQLMQATNLSNVHDIVDGLTAAIDLISQGAQAQTENITTASEMVGQMAGGIEEIAASTQKVASVAKETSDVASVGGKTVNQTIQGMERIKDTVLDSAKRINELGNQSKLIGEIIQVIADIADQTNLLALNAAIEAARAGEQGKGFAVVADEVRKLAERSGKATKEITKLITDIQKSTDSAVVAMTTGTKEVEQGANLAKEAGSALDKILQHVQEAVWQVENISGATEQFSASSSEVVRAMDNVAVVSEENSAATEEMAAGSGLVTRSMKEIGSASQQAVVLSQEISAATEEVNASAEEISHSAEELADMAHELQEMVSKFKI